MNNRHKKSHKSNKSSPIQIKNLETMINFRITFPETFIPNQQIASVDIPFEGINRTIENGTTIVNVLIKNKYINKAINFLESINVTSFIYEQVAVVQFNGKPDNKTFFDLIICLAGKGFKPKFTYVAYDNKYVISPLNVPLKTLLDLLYNCVINDC